MYYNSYDVYSNIFSPLHVYRAVFLPPAKSVPFSGIVNP